VEEIGDYCKKLKSDRFGMEIFIGKFMKNYKKRLLKSDRFGMEMVSGHMCYQSVKVC